MLRTPRFHRQSPPIFGSEWDQIFDTLVPTFVKRRFSPKDSWKEKPFSEDDGRFFSKAIVELSELFTEERTGGTYARHNRLAPYFNQARFRSSYFLYFLPLQCAKFVTLFQAQPEALRPIFDAPESGEPLTVLDLGSGPGTASLGLLIELLRQKRAAIPKIRLYWVDTSRQILADGRALLEAMIESFPELQGKITLETHVGDWLTLPRGCTPASLILVGNLLNELSASELESEKRYTQLADLVNQTKGSGVLFVEPAGKHPSQALSRIRDRFVSEGVLPQDAKSIWGPCLHAEACPLSDGRDWCHFSVSSRVPGKWFNRFSKSLGSEREWIKFSYVWFASQESPSPKRTPGWSLAVSDPLRDPRHGGSSLLLCAPKTPARIPISPQDRIFRGDLVETAGIAFEKPSSRAKRPDSEKTYNRPKKAKRER